MVAVIRSNKKGSRKTMRKNEIEKWFAGGGEAGGPSLSVGGSSMLPAAVLPSDDLLAGVRRGEHGWPGAARNSVDRRIDVRITPPQVNRRSAGARSDRSILLAFGRTTGPR